MLLLPISERSYVAMQTSPWGGTRGALHVQEKIGVRQVATSRQRRLLKGTDFVVGGRRFEHGRWSLGGGRTMPGAHRHDVGSGQEK